MKRFFLLLLPAVSFLLLHSMYAQGADNFSALTQSGTKFAPPTQTAKASSKKPVSKEEEQDIHNVAFDRLLEKYFPLTPTQIHTFKNAVDVQKKAYERPAGLYPAVGTSNIIPVSLKPGRIMPVIRVGRGMITSLVFTDNFGKNWPIVSYSIGDPTVFNVQWNKKSSVLMIQGKKLYAQSNIGVILQGLSVPVMITLLVGQKSWDYLDYIRVQAQRPYGDSKEATAVGQAPKYLISVLNNIPPKSAKALKVSDSSTKVWLFNDKYLVRTPNVLLSPAWISRVKSPGVNPEYAYELTPAPIILVLRNGKVSKVVVSGEVDAK